MKTLIRVLVAEHDKHDLEMIDAELKKIGIDYVSEVVENEAAYRKALKNFLPDVILCDYTFPSFDGPAAFKIREELAPAIPFILVSGTIGEENSIELIKNGVTDFVLKDRIFTLHTKLVRALNDAEERKQRDKTEKELARSEAHLAEAQKLAKMGSWDFDFEADRLTWSKELYNVFGVDNKKFNETHGSFVHLVDEEDRLLVQHTSRHTQLTGDPFTVEYHITTSLGEKRIIREQGYGKKDDKGKITRLFGTAQDITEAKKAEAAIKKAYDEKNAVLESIDDGFFATDENSQVTYWNRKAEILLGVKKENMLGKNCRGIFESGGSSIFDDKFKKATRDNSTVRFEAFSISRDKWFAVSAFASNIGLSVYFKDVTEQKKVAEKIKESELRYRSLIEQATDSICILDVSGKFIEVNPSGCRLFGYSREKMLQLSMTDVLFEEDLKINPIRIDELKEGKTTNNERKIKRKDGTAVDVEMSGKMLQDGKIIVFGRDITERKESERLVKESEAKFRSFFQSSMDGILLTVTDGEILAANPAACEIFKMTEDEICATGRFGVTDLSDPRLYLLIEERKKRGRAKGELTLVRKDGSKFEAELTSAVFTDSCGRDRTSMIIRDISERKAAEYKLNQTSKELQHALNDLTKIMDSSMDIICTVNDAGKFVRVSAASQAIWGYNQEELINKNYINLLYADDLEKSVAKNSEIKNGISITMFENRFIHKNGSIVPMLWSAKWDEHDQLMYCIGKDATEKKRLEKENEIERQRFLGLYLQAPSCMGILKGPDHVFETANPPYMRLIGKPDIIGKTVKEVLPELESQGLFEILDKVYKTGETFLANEMLIQHYGDGSGNLFSTYLNLMYQAHRDIDDEIDGIFFFAIDVTEQVVSRKKIEESEKQYRQIVETAQEGIWVIDENHKTTFVNSKMCEILEYPEAEMMGKDIFYFMDDEAKELAAKLMEKKKGGQSGQKHFKYISKSGKEVWTNVSANPLFDNNGKYKGSLAMVTDITEVKKAENKDRFQATLLNTIGQAAIATDMQGNINFWNKAASKIYGWTEEEVLGKNIVEITTSQPTKKQAEQIMQELLLGNTWSGEFIVKRKEGSQFPAFITNAPIYDLQNQLAGIVGVSYDITERKRAEIDLELSEKRYRQIVETAQEGIWLIDENDDTSFVNKKMCEIVEYSMDELIGKKIYHFMDDQSGKNALHQIERRKQGFSEIHDSTFITKSGKHVWVTISTNPIVDENGKYKGSLAMITDITERKKADQEMTWLVNNTEESFILLDRDLRITSFNNQFKRLFLQYMALNVTKGDCILDYAPPDRRSMVKDIYERVLNGSEEDGAINIPLPDKSVRTFAIKYKPAKNEHGKIIGVFVSAIDVTEKKKSEEQLITQEKRYRALVENGADGVVIVSPEGKMRYASPTTEKLLGYTEEEIMKLDLFSLIHADDVPAVTKVWEQVLSTRGVSVPSHPVRTLHKNGDWRWIEATLTNMLHEPSVNGIVDNFRDITEKIEAEKLREFERIDKEALINTTTDFMWSVTTEFRLIAANEAFITYLEHFDSETRKPGDDLLKPEKFTAAYRAIWRELYTSALRGDSIVKEMHSFSKEKHLDRWFETTLNPIYNDDKVTGVACYSKDITQHKLSEIQLIELNHSLQKQAQELALSNEELEQFAYVASHDLQEPLRMITSFLTQLEKKYGGVIDDRGKQYIAFAVDGAKRMRQIILDLLEFSRVGRTEDRQEDIDPNELVAEIQLLFRKQILEKRAIIITNPLPIIRGYRSPIRQVFQNLLSNALKYTKKEEATRINITCRELTDHWQFEIDDNGIGIENEYFDKIFTIFQRLHSKDEFSGTGMGLAITKKIVETQGGKIWVKSELGKGSTFYFTLSQKN